MICSTRDKEGLVKTTVQPWVLQELKTVLDLSLHQGVNICSALQDLSRPSASSSASLARMIGGLALAGATADITEHPPSPKPARGSQPQALVFSQGPQSSSFRVTADGAQGLSGGGNAAAGPSSQGPDSEDQDQAGTSGGSGGIHARQGDVAGAMRMIGAAPAPHCPAALGQNDAAPAAGEASGAAGMSNSTAAGVASGSHMLPWSNTGTQVANCNEKGGYSSSNAAANRAALQEPTGSPASGMGSPGAPADPSSIAAYRSEGRAVNDGAWSRMGAGIGMRVGADKQGQGGPSGLDLHESLRRQSIAGEKSSRSGGGDLDAGRQTLPAGQSIQVRVYLHVCR